MRELVGKNLGKYQVVAYLGGGGMADVYKAYHPGLDRYVAIKVMNEQFAAERGSMSRFEREAVAVARLRHPNIVQVHDFEAQSDLPYLVMEFIEGPTLRAELHARRHKKQLLDMAEVAHLFSALTDAVDYAHSQGVIHRDLKPDNVMITTGGQVVLTDFGIAQMINVSAETAADVTGTPLYMSPEQVQGDPADRRSDIYSLGVILYEMSVGRAPFEAETPWKVMMMHVNQPPPLPTSLKSNLPAAVEQVIIKALAKTPEERYQRANDLGRALRLAVGLLDEQQAVVAQIAAVAPAPQIKEISFTPDRPLLSSSAPRPASPYRGLFAFREADAPFFFGREAFVAQLVAAVQRQPLAAVLGPSGSGKSSVVFAGLLPRLRRGTVASSTGSGGGRWQIASCRPGSQPFQAVARALLALSPPGQPPVEAEALAEQLLKGETRLAAILSQLAEQQPDSRLLLILDQFEEIFTLVPDHRTRARFIDELMAAVEAGRRREPASPFTILLTMRADFLGQALDYRALADALQEADVKLGPMTRQELDRAIENPAGRQGILFERGLAARILDDVGDEPGRLPLLQFALTLLWERQQAGLLTHDAYEAIGRVEGALAHYAEEVYLALQPDKQLQARQLFIQLVRPGQRTDDTRRLATRAELGETNWALARGLANARLVVTGRDAAGQETVEVVHEALIRGWSRLREWMEGDRAFRMWQERLRQALRQWEGSGQDEGALLRGALLAEAESWLHERPDNISPAEQRFIEAGIELRRRDQLARERQRRRMMIGLAGGLVLMAVALVITLALAAVAGLNWQRAGEAAEQARAAAEEAETQRGVAESQKQEAEAQRQEAELQRQRAEAQSQLAFVNGLMPQAINLAATQPDLALLLSLEASRLSQEASLETEQGLLTTLERNPYPLAFLRGHMRDDLNAIAISPDGQILASAGNDQMIILWDLESYQPLGPPLASHADWIYSLAFSPDGQTLASGSGDGEILLWDVKSRQRRDVVLAGHTDWVSIVAFSPDGALLASAGGDNEIILWAPESGEEVGRLSGHTGPVQSIAFSPTGPALASGSDDQTIMIWNLETLQPQSEPIKAHTDAVYSLAFSPDGQTLASGGRDNMIILWDMTRQPYQPRRRPLSRHTGSVLGLAFSPDGRRLASSSWDRTIILWNPETGQPVGAPLTGHTGQIWRIAFHPNGQMLASAGADGNLIVWDVAGQQRLGRPLTEQPGGILSLAFSPDGQLLSSAGADNRVILWDMATRQPLGQPLASHTNWVHRAVFSPDGQILASGSDDQSIILWNVATGVALDAPLKGHSGGVLELAFNPANGQILASAGGDETVRLWDLETGQPLLPPLTGHTGLVWSVAFSPDGQTLASAGEDGRVLVWSAEDGRQLAELAGHTDEIYSLAFSPDGQLLASGGLDTAVILWDMNSYETSGEPLTGHSDTILNLAFSPDGKTLASTGWDEQIILWDTATRQPLFPPLTGHTERVEGLAFSPDGQTLASGGLDGKILFWDPSTGQQLTESLAGHRRVIRSVAFSPDGRTLAWGSEDETVTRWDINRATQLGSPLEGHTDYVNSVAFSPDGRLLASASGDGQVILWDAASGQPVGEPLAEHGDWVRGVAFSPDGRWLASASGDKTIMIWDTESGQRLQQLSGHSGEVTTVAFSPDGQWLASGSDDETVILWDAGSGDLVQQFSGHTEWINQVAFSPDSRLLASGSDDGSIRLWDVSEGQAAGQPLIGHTSWVLALAFSPDGSMLVSGGGDKKIILWDVARRQQLGALTGHGDAVNSLAFSPDGQLLVSAGRDGSLMRWELEPALWQAQACRLAGRNLTWSEWQQFMAGQPYQATCPDLRLYLAELALQADSFAQAGQIEAASASYAQAVAAALETEADILNNNICWFGSIGGLAEVVLPACERAVEIGNEDNQGLYRDSRGLARALAGDYEGAVEDFEFFVDWSGGDQQEDLLVQKRLEWISALKAGRNPFDAATLAALREE